MSIESKSNVIDACQCLPLYLYQLFLTKVFSRNTQFDSGTALHFRKIRHASLHIMAGYRKLSEEIRGFMLSINCTVVAISQMHLFV